MFDLTTNLLFITVVFNLFLGTIILIHGPKTRANIAYAVLVGVLVLWALSIVFLRSATSAETAFASLAASYMCGAAIAASFWYFVMYFNERVVSALQRSAIFGGALVVSLAAFFSPYFIESIQAVTSQDKILNVGPLHLIFIAYFSLVMLDAFVKLFKKYRASGNARERAQLAAVFTGTLITTIIGSVLNIFFVQAGIAHFIGFGPVATVIMVSFIAYAIMRHNFMSIKVIGAEFFTLLLVLLLSVRLIIANTPFDRIWNGIGLFFAAGIGILLIRSVYREVKDREEIAKLATELQHSNEELRKLDQLKSEFISLASHQLRSPLTIIRGYVSLALEGTLGAITAETRDGLAKVAYSADQLIKLINSLLNLTRIEAGKIRYDLVKSDFAELIGGIIEEFRPMAVKKGLSLIFENSAKELVPFMFDPDKMREVIINMVDNAIKYSESGEIRVRLAYGAGKDAIRRVRFSVTDNGIGVMPDDQRRLFAKFVRSEDARKTDPGGSGIGLYFAKRVVEDHKGTVGVTSEGRGRGSTFFVELPVIE